MIRHIEKNDNTDRDDLIYIGVFKPISGNSTKLLRVRQKTLITTKNRTFAKTTLK